MSGYGTWGSTGYGGGKRKPATLTSSSTTSLTTGETLPEHTYIPAWQLYNPTAESELWSSKWVNGTLTDAEYSTPSFFSNISSDGFLPLYVVNDGLQDGTNYFVLEITGSNTGATYGFSQETYVLTERWDTTASLPSTSTSGDRRAYLTAAYRVDGASKPNHAPKIVGGSSRKEVAVIIEDAQGPRPHQLDNSSNRYLGDSKANVIYAGGGNDEIDGGAGNDTLRGQLGNDSLYGQANSDVLLGDEGGDILYGGNETPPAGAPTFSLSASNGDILNGGSGSDILYGQDGWDTLDGMAGNDVLYGGNHDDSLNGHSGTDSLNGGSGNDTLTGGSDADKFFFDSGRVFAASDVGTDTITDFIRGSDKIVLDKTTFTRLTSAAGSGFTVASEFAVVTSDSRAATSGALIVFNRSNGKLFYNENKTTSGLGTGGQFAALNPLPSSALAGSDFTIQS